MRVPSLAAGLGGLLALAACQTTAPPPDPEPRAAPSEQAAIEARLDVLLAAAADPDTDAAAFGRFVAARDRYGSWRPARGGGVAAARLAEVREVLAAARRDDGRFPYETEEYVVQPSDGVEWHVLRVAFEDAVGDPGRATSEAEFAFIPSDAGYLLLQLFR